MSQRGIALITVIVVFALVLVTIAGTIALTRVESSTIETNKQAEQAFNLAEAGIDWAAAKLRANPQMPATSTILALQTGQAKTVITRTTTKVTVISTGILNSAGSGTPTAQRAIKTEFLSQTGFDAGGMWDRAITANGQISGSGNISIHADNPVNGPTTQSNLVRANSIQLSGNINVLGTPGVGYVPGGSAQLSGNIGSTTTGQVPPDLVGDIDLNYWRNLCQSQAGVVTVAGDWNKSGNYTFTNGLYVSGNLYMSGNYTLGGIIFAEGNIELSGNFSGQATFVSKGNITMSGNVDVSGMNGVAMIAANNLTNSGNKQINGYIYAGNNVTWSGNADLVGGISCKGNVTLSGNIDIRFVNLTDKPNLPPGMSATNVSLTLISWQEVTP